MVALRPDRFGQLTADAPPLTQPAEHVREIPKRPPAQLTPRAFVDIHAVDAREHAIADAFVDRLHLRRVRAHHRWRVGVQTSAIALPERTGSADDVPPEPDYLRLLEREHVRADDILDIDTPEQELVGLAILVRIQPSHLGLIIRLRKEPRSLEHDARQAM